MFKEIKIDEKAFINLLNLNDKNTNYLYNPDEVSFIQKLKDCEHFELGYIIDIISDGYAISKSIYNFIKECKNYNGFLKERVVENVEYIEVVIKNTIKNNAHI